MTYYFFAPVDSLQPHPTAGQLLPSMVMALVKTGLPAVFAGLLVWRRGSLVPVIIEHTLVNAIASAPFLKFGGKDEMTHLSQFLQHERLPVRTGAALSIGYVLLYIGWAVGYYLLPEFALQGWLSGSARMEPEGFLSLALQLFGYNLALPGLLTLGLSRIQAGGYNLGYNVPFANTVLYGLWLGTNSFAVPMPERMAPTLSLFWSRSGAYEMAAFTLLAAALARSAWLAQRSIWGGPTVRIPAAERRLRPAEYAIIGLAFLLLAGSSATEAWMWLQRIQPR